MQQQMRKPAPFIYKENKRFFDGTLKHELHIQRCKDCHKFYFYPRTACPHCLSENTEWVKASGKGKVYSFTICERPGNPAHRAPSSARTLSTSLSPRPDRLTITRAPRGSAFASRRSQAAA